MAGLLLVHAAIPWGQWGPASVSPADQPPSAGARVTRTNMERSWRLHATVMSCERFLRKSGIFDRDDFVPEGFHCNFENHDPLKATSPDVDGYNW